MSKYKQVKVNFLPDDFEKLQNLADSAEMTKAQFLRQAIDLTLPNVREKKGKVKKNISTQTLFEIAKIGTNLNQIAHHCNINKQVDTNILKSLVSIESMLNSLL